MKINNVRILKCFGINGMVLYPFILYAERPSPEIENHERIHWDQVKRDGVWGFYFRYVREYLSNRRKGMKHDEAYRMISYEREAYAHQHELSYVVEHQRPTRPG